MLTLLLVGCTEHRQASLMERAEQSLSQGRYAEAANLFRKAVALSPDSQLGIKGLYKLGFTEEVYLKDYESAVFNYGEFVRESSDPIGVYEVQKRIANIYYEELPDNDKAITAYRKLITLDPKSLEVDSFQLRIGKLFFKEDNFDQARLEFQTLLDKFPKSPLCPEARFEIGNSYYMQGKYDIAVEALKQVVRNYPQNDYATEAQFLIGESLEQAQKLKEALQIYESIEGHYSSPEILHERIVSLQKRIKKEKQ